MAGQAEVSLIPNDALIQVRTDRGGLWDRVDSREAVALLTQDQSVAVVLSKSGVFQHLVLIVALGAARQLRNRRRVPDRQQIHCYRKSPLGWSARPSHAPNVPTPTVKTLTVGLNPRISAITGKMVCR